MAADAAHDLNKKEGQPLADNWADFADGRVLSGKQALNLGFVDELGDFDDAVDRARKIAHIDNANLVEYRERYDISNFLSMFGQSSQAHDIKLDLGVDMPKLQAGCMYFLWHAAGIDLNEKRHGHQAPAGAAQPDAIARPADAAAGIPPAAGRNRRR